MKRRIPIIVLAIMLGTIGITIGATRLTSQSQSTPLLTPDQIAAIHGQRVAHVDTSSQTIPQLLAKTTDQPEFLYQIA
jgi:hypothetical protein